MLDITTISRQSLGKVVSYYADGADDYYAKDGGAMQWQGAGAEALGLSGEVEQARFRELLDGRISDSTKLMRTVKEADGKAIAYVKLHDKDLARDFIWQVQLEKDVNGLWTATRILNFTDYLKERMDG